MMNSSKTEQEALTHLELVLRQVRREAIGINSYELVDPDQKDLPPFTAGAHIDVHIAPGVIRQYSLCNDPSERHRYVIAVLRDESGRGGSRRMHDDLRVPDKLKVSIPRNNFPLSEQARKTLLIAGGIGITPLKSMIHALEAQEKNYELHYCSKSPEYAAFQRELELAAKTGNIHCHFDGGNPQNGLDIAALLREAQTETHVYYCGPGGFMEACKQASTHWPAGTIHCEHFKAPAKPIPIYTEHAAGEYTVELAKSGQRVTVSRDQNLAEVLQQAGAALETSCQAGLCGTCKCRYLSGEVDHQDFILDDDERRDFLTPCVSHGNGGTLVLDV
ncbi:PDR/VanB family oxidoreductase [Bordetella genomosp. 4]|uniref:PDR/VanB family oxidoreductase n=1 Tax=Bordetella genomosp. 4 TaxID=463044 RepID=UPI0020CED92A|nr:PDR/VanB family oxidoreductase [Bordetella genomosp. 4]